MDTVGMVALSTNSIALAQVFLNSLRFFNVRAVRAEIPAAAAKPTIPPIIARRRVVLVLVLVLGLMFFFAH